MNGIKNIIHLNKKISDKYYKNFSEINRFSKTIFISEIKKVKSENILDVGCGTGMLSKKLIKLGYKPLGIDISEKAIQKYNKIAKGKIVDLEKKLPFKQGYFSNIIASEVIEHINNFDFFISEIKRVCKEGGKIHISTPNSNFWVYRIYSLFGYCLPEVQHPGHISFFSDKLLNKLFLKNGLTITSKHSNYVLLILPDLNIKIYSFILSKLTFKKELRYKTKKYFWHFSFKKKKINNFWSETLMYTLKN